MKSSRIGLQSLCGQLLGRDAQKQHNPYHRWKCIVCQLINGPKLDACTNCARKRDPDWLRAQGLYSLDIGNVVELDPSGKSTVRRITRALVVRVCDAADLACGDKKGKSDPFVRVFFNDVLLGKTQYIEDDHDPVWDDETFLVLIPGEEEKLAQCNLRLEVRDHDITDTEGDFLGEVILTGHEILRLCGGSLTEGGQDAGRIEYALKKSSKRERQVVQGGLAIDLDLHPEPCYPVKMHVQSATGLANGDKTGKSDPFASVFFNGHKVGITHTVTNNHEPNWAEKTPPMFIPVPIDVTGCQLKVVVRDFDAKGEGDFLGQMQLKGDHLLKLPPANEPTTFELEHDLEQAREPLQGNLQVKFRPPISNQRFGLVTVHVLAARNLLSGDKRGKSDPYVLLHWNNMRVGQSSVVMNDHAPVWEGQSFRLPMPLDQNGAPDVQNCALRLEVRDHDNDGSQGDFLGQAAITGEETWRGLLTKMPPMVPPMKQIRELGEWFQLQKRDKSNLKEWQTVQGEVCIYFHKGPAVVAGKSDGTLIASQLQDRKNRGENAKFPDEFPPCLGLEATVISASDLICGDKTGKSDPYVLAYCGGQLIAQTLVIDNNHDPTWEDENFLLTILLNEQKEDGCNDIRMEVRDHDVKGLGDFLGEVYLNSKDVKSLLADFNDCDEAMEYELTHKPAWEVLPVQGSIILSFETQRRKDINAAIGVVTEVDRHAQKVTLVTLPPAIEQHRQHQLRAQMRYIDAICLFRE